MTWKIRHEGSPKSVAVPDLQQVAEGLLDGRWEVTDEVMGPQDKGWVVIENHPRLAEIAADIEPLPPHEHPDESNLDMTALIDVCLVLLIFFMLLLVYAVALQKMIDSPELNADNPDGVPHVSKEKVEKSMILVTIRQEAKGPVIKIEDREVDKDDLAAALTQIHKKNPNKVEVVIDHDREVPHGSVVAVEDAAKSAGINKVYIAVPKEELGK
jgi:biopolymer transport protein ExbD